MTEQSHILIIEDEDLLAGVLQDKLTQAGFHVSRAKDAEDGLSVVRENTPTLIVTDILLPGMDGIEMITLIRNEGFSVPIIALTNLEDTREVAAILNGPNDRVLKKTYQTLENLVTTISNAARHAI